MCGSLLSKFNCGSRIVPAPGTEYLQTKRVPTTTKLTDEPTVVRITSLVEAILDKDTEIKPCDSEHICTARGESESNAKEKATEIKSLETKTTVEPSIKIPGDIPPKTIKETATEIKSAAVTATEKSPADCPRDIPHVNRPTVDIRKVKEMLARDMARLQTLDVKTMSKEKVTVEAVFKEKIAKEDSLAKEKRPKETFAKEEFLAKQKLPNETFAKEDSLAKEKRTKETFAKEDSLAKEKRPNEQFAKEDFLAKQVWPKQQFDKEKPKDIEKLKEIQGGESSSSNTVATKPISSARSILLGKTKSAIAFEVLVGSNRKETVLLSARVPRRLRRMENPPELTAEVMREKQLAAREKRLKELERVRHCARASSKAGTRKSRRKSR